MTALAAMIMPGKFLRMGDAGPDVKEIQLALGKLGYPLTGTGYFGPATDTAVEAFQKRAGLTVDGDFGNKSALALDRALGSNLAAIPEATKAEIALPLWYQAGLKLIGTKEGVGARDNPNIIQWAKDEGGDIAATYTHDSIPWCFTADTELLTERGFVRFDQVIDGERVYQSDSDGLLSIAPAVRIEKQYDGDVFDIKHASIQLTCDVGHRWFGEWNSRNRDMEFRSFEEITTAGLRIPAVKSSAVGVGLSDQQIQLLAAFLADGKERRTKGRQWSIEFEVSRQRKIAALTALVPLHIYQQKKAYGPLTKTPLTVFRFAFPEFFAAVFSDYKRLARPFIAAMSATQAGLFLKTYAQFDGDGKSSLYTSDEAMRDDLVTIALMAGFAPSVTKATGSELSKKQPWKVRFSAKPRRTILPHHLRRRHFSGRMYCVSVPRGRIVVRGQNGTPIMTGNCALFQNHLLTLAGLKGTGTLWALDFAGHWPCQRLSGPAVGAFAPMLRSGGGHIVQIAGKDQRGNFMCLGGNQSDAVNIEPFAVSRLNKGFWWPAGQPLPRTGFANLPVVSSNGRLSSNEA